MIGFGKILKRSWHILWNYKILWIFGFLLALATGGGGNSGMQFSTSHPSQSTNLNKNIQISPDLNPWFQQNILPILQYPGQHISTFIWIGVGLLLFLLIVGVLITFIRYVSETAAIRMVNEYEQSGTRVGFKKGWRMGWSRAAFRLWLIDLITALPFLLFVLILAGSGLVIYFGATSASRGFAIVSVVAAVGCILLFTLFFILLAILIGLLRKFFVRVAVLENAGVGESFRRGWQMFTRNFKNAALMWLIMVGIGIAFMIAITIIFFLLIPAYIVMLVPGVIIAAIPGLIIFGITSIFAGSPLTWILGLIAAAPFLLVVVFAPLILVSGWYIIYENNVWTLTYREIKALENIAPVH